MAKPWDRASGWEYDLLRTLPPEEQSRVWQAALRQAFTTRRARTAISLLMFPVGLIHVFTHLLAAQLGIGWFGGVVLGLGPDALYARVVWRYLPPLLRSFVREELARLASSKPESSAPESHVNPSATARTP